MIRSNSTAVYGKIMTRRALIGLVAAVGFLIVVAMIALTVLIFTTSAPEIIPRTFAPPNTQLQAKILSGQAIAAEHTDLAYVDSTRPKEMNPLCTSQGRWSLEVNPQDVIGHPFAPMPTARDWTQAATVIEGAQGICPAAVVLTWLGHNPVHPSSDRWTALLPGFVAANIDGRALQRYALSQANQE